MNKPIYCKTCNSQNSWVRNPVRDIKGMESGKTLWLNYKCKICGSTTVCLVEESNEVKVS